MYFYSLEHNDSVSTIVDATQAFSVSSTIDETSTPLSACRLKRQLATSSLNTPEFDTVDNNNVLSDTESESIGSLLDHIINDDNSQKTSPERTVPTSIENDNTIHQLIRTLSDNTQIKRSSYNESERTDSGIGDGLSARDSGSGKFSTYDFQKLSLEKISVPEHFDSGNIQKVPSSRSLSTNSNSSCCSSENSTSKLKQSLSNINSNPINNNNNDYDLSIVHDSSLKKAGWLNVKYWLTTQRQRVELASHRKWKRYWICLKGQDLFLYTDYSDTDENITPKLSI
ncbi:unnamed protein product, partial [Didymodactylos carnosus]